MLFGKREWSLTSRQCVIRMSWCHPKLSLSQGVFYFPSEFLLPSISFLLAVPLSFLLWPVELSSPSQRSASTSKHVLTFVLFSLRNFSSFTDLWSHQVHGPSSQLLLTFKISFLLIAKLLFAFVLSLTPLPLAMPCSCPAFLFASCHTSLCSNPAPGSHELIFPLLLLQLLNSYSKKLFQLVHIATYSPLLFYIYIAAFFSLHLSCQTDLTNGLEQSSAPYAYNALWITINWIIHLGCWMPSWWYAWGIFTLHWGWWSAGSVWPLEANDSALGW